MITGANSGIGEAIALALAREGARLILTARDAQRLETVRAQCAVLGAETLTFSADVTDETQVQALADFAHGRVPAVDLLINNAGVVMAGLVTEVPAEDWRRLHDINVMGVVHSCRAFLPKMTARKQGGHVVNIASVAGFAGQRGMSTYCASKFAVMGLSECLRAEMHRHGIGVTVVCPGYVRTPIEGKVKVVGRMNTPKVLQNVQRDFKRGLKPETVAARTLTGIRRNQAIVRIGREAFLAHTLKRWAPGLLERYQRG
ncbi:MAG: SDR family NAD(P)-dependent oxidoreductase [Burkholderiales bacterium]